MELRRHRWSIMASVLGLAAVVFAFTGGLHRSSGDTAQASPPTSAASGPVTLIDGMTVVEVGMAAQRRSGLQVQALGSTQAPSGPTAYGTVMDLQPLVAWTSKVGAAAAQASAAHAEAQAAEAELARTRALYRDNENASLKSLQAAQSASSQAKANAEAAEAALQALRREGRLQFGSTIVGDGLTHARTGLLDHRHALVRVAMPPAIAVPRAVDVAYGTAPPSRARWLSASPQADAQLGAEVQLYEVDQALPANSSVSVNLPAQSAAEAGVLVPLAAVVWYADQPWVYVQRDETHFARVALLSANEEPQGFFVPAGLHPGQQVVTRGAGLLLSQEQIPPPGSGNGCKDPECDD